MATTSKCEDAIHGPHSRKQMIERKRSISRETPGYIECPEKAYKLRLEINYNNFDYHKEIKNYSLL